MEWPGEQLLIKMWETHSEKGIGSLLRPWQIKREGFAHIELRRAELIALAQAEKDAEGSAGSICSDKPYTGCYTDKPVRC
ncbi:MAG: hypothetical protein AB1427_19795 [Thermodesulfobacteriota bacterium]